MRKILITLLALISLVFVLTSCSGSEPEFNFERCDADSYMVSITNADKVKVKTIVIPDTYEGKPVTAVKQEGFANIKSVKKIIIPDSIKTIGDSAFANCKKLTRVEIGRGVEEIGGQLSVYQEPTSNNVSILDSFLSIGDVTVSSPIFITSDVVEVDEDTAIWTSNPWSRCEKLKKIIVDAANEEYKSVNGSLYTKDGKNLVQYAIGKKNRTFKIPKGVETIDDYALYFSAHLKKVVLPDSLSGLYDVDYDDPLYQYMGITSMPQFLYCSSLKKIKVSDSHPDYKTIDGNLYTKDGTVLIQYAEGKKARNFTIPEGVTTTSNFAFYYCESLKKITLPSTVSEVVVFPQTIEHIAVNENNANYKSLDGVLFSKDEKILYSYPANKSGSEYVVPSSVEVIDAAFSTVLKLETLIIGDNVKTIKSGAIAYCPNLKNVSIGNGVEVVEENAFMFDMYENKITYNEYDNALYLGNDSNPYLILVKAKDKDITNCSINERTRIICDYAFCMCSSLKSVTIPNGITRIPNMTFYYCTSLKNIVIPESVTEIGANAFGNCSSLESIVIPASVTTIDATYLSHPFYNCNQLRYVYFKGTEEQWGSLLLDLVLPNVEVVYNYNN